MISLILPKLIRSVARDGIWTFSCPVTQPDDIFYSTTQGKAAMFNRELAKPRNPDPLEIPLELDCKYKLGTGPKRGDALSRRRPDESARDYLTSTFAPASSSFFLAASVSALLAPSRIGFGAPSTRALASARPKPAFTSRTALMTAIFLSAGTEAMITSNVSFAAAAGAAAAPPGAAAAAAGAAAVTP